MNNELQVGRFLIKVVESWGSSGGYREIRIIEISEKAVKMKYIPNGDPTWVDKSQFGEHSKYRIVEKLNDD